MALVQRAIEAVGISTVSITLVESVARRVKPPRALLVPYTFGNSLGEPNNPALQHEIIAEALALLTDEGPLPILREKSRSVA